MPKITFEFESNHVNAWGATISNEGCQPPQLLMVAQKRYDLNRRQDTQHLVSFEFPDEDTLDCVATASLDITPAQFDVVAKWAEIMAERGFATHIMMGEAQAQRSHIVDGSEDEIEMLRLLGKLPPVTNA